MTSWQCPNFKPGKKKPYGKRISFCEIEHFSRITQITLHHPQNAFKSYVVAREVSIGSNHHPVRSPLPALGNNLRNRLLDRHQRWRNVTHRQREKHRRNRLGLPRTPDYPIVLDTLFRSLRRSHSTPARLVTADPCQNMSFPNRAPSVASNNDSTSVRWNFRSRRR